MLITLLLAAIGCGVPNERGTPPDGIRLPARTGQFQDELEPAPEEVRDVAAYQEGALVEGPLVAVVNGTVSHPGVAGRVLLTPDQEDTVRVDARMVGLPPGSYVYSVHLRGDCSDPGGQSMGGPLAFERLPRFHETPAADVGIATAPEGGPRKGPPGIEEMVPQPGEVVLPEPQRTTRGSTLPDDPDPPTRRPTPVEVEAEEPSPTAGRLGDLAARPDGTATHSGMVTGLFPDNLGHLVGRAVVVEAEDGAPLACGVLVVPAG